ncbi:restriction endonuclease subunit S [Leptolyngbya ohadii]|uniref:restriction endonuclease subunit S n=1 Tax=Leptolyngbya ohadii TaxID=1962290 RepID=UPI000B59D579|nr:restriction endonuclease subunit S [Leptolyngbya ohadii]
MSNKADLTNVNQETERKLKPKLRFRDFRDAEEWSNEKLKSLYSFKATNSYSRDKLNYENGLVKNIHYGDIHTKFSALFNIENEIVPFINPSESLEKISIDSYCVEGDIIFADASEDLDGVGKSIEIVHLNNEKLLSGLHTLLARQRDNRFVVGFGGHLFKSSWMRTQIKRESQGAKVLGISATRLSNIDVVFPSNKKEQQKIADCLSSIDDRITAENQKLDTLKAHKKGLMQQLFPVEGKTLPKLRFIEFRNASEWEVKRIEDLSVRGSGHTPNKSQPSYYNGGIKWVSLADSNKLDNGYIYETKVEISKEGLKNSSAVLHPVGTVIISRDAGVGKSAVLYSEMAVSQHFIAWRCDESKLSNWFLYYFLQVLKPKFEAIATGSTIKTIGLPYFKEICITIPSVLEQKKIADCLISIDELVAAQTQKIEALKLHKKGLMQQLFPSINEVSG